MTRMTRYRARVELLAAEQSGRPTPFLRQVHRCPLRIGGELLDCCIFFEAEAPIALGREYDAAVEFLSPELAREVIGRTREFEVVDGPTAIGHGVILDVDARDRRHDPPDHVMTSRVKQIIADWRSGDRQVLAVVGPSPGDLQEHLGIVWQSATDGLDQFVYALLEAPNGRVFALRSYPRSPVPGTDIVTDLGMARDECSLDEALSALGMTRADVTWLGPMISDK